MIEIAGYTPIITNQVYSQSQEQNTKNPQISLIVMDCYQPLKTENILEYLCRQSLTIDSTPQNLDEMSIRGKLNLLPEETLKLLQKRDPPLLKELGDHISIKNDYCYHVRAIQGRLPLTLVDRLKQMQVLKTVSDYSHILLFPTAAIPRPLTFLSWNFKPADPSPECWSVEDNCCGGGILASLVGPHLTPKNISLLYDSSAHFQINVSMRLLDSLLKKQQPLHPSDLPFGFLCNS